MAVSASTRRGGSRNSSGENARLKKLVADQALDVAILREAAKGNF